MARDPGGLLRRSLPGASNGAGRLQMAPDEQRGSRQPLSQTRPSRRSSQGRRAWLTAVARKIAERGCRKATPFGAGNRPTHGCGVGTRAPVAPSPALPAGLSALAASERRMDVDPGQMESAPSQPLFLPYPPEPRRRPWRPWRPWQLDSMIVPGLASPQVDWATHGPRKGYNPPLQSRAHLAFFLARELRSPGAGKEGVPCRPILVALSLVGLSLAGPPLVGRCPRTPISTG
jgi:hypothetical protein